MAQTEEARQKVQQCYNREWMRQAPLYIIIYAANDKAWVREEDGKSHADIDAAIAIEHLCLAATAVGLGSCWVCNFNVATLQAAFHIGQEWHPVAILPIGYPASAPTKPSPRKEMNEIVSRF